MKNKVLLRFAVVTGFSLLLAAALSAPRSSAQETEPLPWWNDRVFYEVFVRSFYDSDGDGTGDLQGLISKLDYLNDGDPSTTSDLGVTGLWLMPINASPSYHGYDVVDYYSIEPDYGTLDDFRQLLDEAHARGMAVIMDLVMNHTSAAHPWFEASRASVPEYADWYIWEGENPGFPGPWGQSVWHRTGRGYYYGIFWEGMPDLNYRNPNVTGAMYDVIRYWLADVGVDGFRLDAVRHLIEDGSVQENTPETHAWLENYHAYVESLNPNALSVGEIWTDSRNIVPYIGDEVDVAFEFDLSEAMLASADLGSNIAVRTTQQRALGLFPNGQYAAFITNHDQNRVVSQLNGSAQKARVAASMLLTNPGVPFIYYGEEIGMTGVKPDERIRTPMEWESGEGGGFTSGRPWQAFSQGYEARSVAAQTDDPASLLSHYRGLAQLRGQREALQSGSYTWIASSTPKIYAFLRATPGETLLILINLDDVAVSEAALSADASPLRGRLSAEILYADGIPPETSVAVPALDAVGGFEAYVPLPELPPFATLIVSLEG